MSKLCNRIFRRNGTRIVQRTSNGARNLALLIAQSWKIIHVHCTNKHVFCKTVIPIKGLLRHYNTFQSYLFAKKCTEHVEGQEITGISLSL